MMYRIFERVLAAAVLAMAMPVLLALVIWIRCDSAGAPVFTQIRVGQLKKPFVLLKLRTMATGTEQVGTHEVSVDRVTSVGRFLRRSKLDELPQLWNVVRGEMCLVGPRPCLPGQADVIAAREARDVFSVRPGITGLAQVRGIDMSTPVLLAEADAEYIAQRSVAMDIALLKATVSGGGQGDRIKT